MSLCLSPPMSFLILDFFIFSYFLSLSHWERGAGVNKQLSESLVVN